MRKPVEDAAAREAATVAVARLLEGFILHETPDIDVRPTLYRAASRVLAAFRYAETETVTRDVQGEPVRLQRVVLTGLWEVADPDPNWRGWSPAGYVDETVVEPPAKDVPDAED